MFDCAVWFLRWMEWLGQMTEYKVRIIYDWVKAQKELVTRDTVAQRPTAGVVTIIFGNGAIVRLGKDGNKAT